MKQIGSLLTAGALALSLVTLPAGAAAGMAGRLSGRCLMRAAPRLRLHGRPGAFLRGGEGRGRPLSARRQALFCPVLPAAPCPSLLRAIQHAQGDGLGHMGGSDGVLAL